MRILLSIFLVFIFATVISCSVIVGRNHCTYGPSYWCSNITNAKSCGAVRHCIKAVWEKQHVPEDNDSICQICLDMVKQARDQLESNETMEEIREVFDGSCDLIPISIVKKECKRMADDFIPELVEALASQMNPQVVCSTAGLCNNAAIDKLLEEYEAQRQSFNCDKCNDVGDAISNKFHTSSRDQVLDGFLSACGHLSSFSDACSSIVLTYFDNIYDELSKNLKSDNICHMSGACSSKYHNHDSSNIEIKTQSNVGFINNKDDIPCELCEQLVKHLRDVLVANTTEQEFKSVLLGLCSQTKGFKEECNTIINQYYGIIYETLVKNLDANGVCFLIGLCDKGIKTNGPKMPLLPSKQVYSRKRLGQNEKVFTNAQIQSMVLPIDQLMGAKSTQDLIDGGQQCAICTYFLHFLQEELSNAKNEDQIKELVKKTCSKFPKTFQPSCDSFVDLYGDAIIALLVQEIDPRDLCPQLKLCPSNVNQDDVDIFSPNTINVEINQKSAPSCPLCELVVAQARQFIENPKSKESAKSALSKVCKHLPPKPQLQCNDFIQTYYDELIDKLLSDLTPKGVCSLLKLCPGKTEITEDTIKVGVEKANFIPHIIVTNEILDNTIDGQIVDTGSGECLLCTYVVGGAQSKISRSMTKQQIEDVLLSECSKFHPYQGICDNFVEKNVDEIVDLLSEGMTPKQICQKLSLCAIEDDLNNDEDVIINIVAIPAVPIIGRVTLTKDDTEIYV
ncbi:unnamed protein product [Chironomus riparius]|uniref:Proactivator polypeptide n=1 Tax=Chironomus riparius TaxID=315576 RepID=A0A9N9RVT2_9DIPT|nr:unnamed protein product [Chironomus riparius]